MCQLWEHRGAGGVAVDAATSVTGHVRAPARANSCPCVRVRVRVCTHAWHARGVCPSSLVPVCTAGQQHASHARARGGSTGSEVRAPRARARLAARAWRKGSARLPRAAPSAVALAARASARGASLQSYPTFGATTRTRTRTELLRIGTLIGGEMPAMAAQPRAARACGRIPRVGRRTRARTAAREGAGGDSGGAQQPPPGFRSRWCDVLRDVRLIVCGAYGVAGAAHVADLLGPQLALRVNGAPSLDELSALGRAGAVRARLPLQCCAARCPLSPKR